MAQALVPLKDLVLAKTRLSGLLSPSERRALTQAMLEDVLAVLAVHPEIQRVTLVSDDPSAHLLAGQYGAVHWPESELRCSGLNNIVGAASARLLVENEQPLLVLHADLPLLCAQDISAVLALRRLRPGLVVGCDRHGSGTNLLCFDASSVPDFCFGTDSCARHMASARARGIAATKIQRPGIGLDVDEPRDLALLLQRMDALSDSHTAALLHQSGLGARVSLALESLGAPALTLDEIEVS